jgi:hypothetical protein
LNGNRPRLVELHLQLRVLRDVLLLALHPATGAATHHDKAEHRPSAIETREAAKRMNPPLAANTERALARCGRWRTR